MFFKDSMDQDKLKEFIIRLIKGNGGRKVFLILDNLRAHHGKKIKKWLKEHKDEVEIFYLPAYAPEYNPDEYFNGNLKRELSKLPSAKTSEKLESNARGIVRKILM